ncbi:hypothetical protein HPB52_001322 [Rhipicephalus sanguineus]|uniref:Uncharacterized protein n=1 Tax=Rhipicephalus sanguineus TaxID=34632 RepID=A0A9D4SS75_RHISA|nr:hypothetical protein HPB52_001322 [Rhipicephalus sanguineus]
MELLSTSGVVVCCEESQDTPATSCSVVEPVGRSMMAEGSTLYTRPTHSPRSSVKGHASRFETSSLLTPSRISKRAKGSGEHLRRAKMADGVKKVLDSTILLQDTVARAKELLLFSPALELRNRKLPSVMPDDAVSTSPAATP